MSDVDKHEENMEMAYARLSDVTTSDGIDLLILPELLGDEEEGPSSEQQRAEDLMGGYLG